MVILIIGVFSETTSFFQKTLFLIGALLLTIVAFKNNQKMLLTLQCIVTFGNFLAFFQIEESLWYILLAGAAIIGLAHLIGISYYKNDKCGVVGSIGLLMLALGFATNANTSPLLFGAFIGFGAILVAGYSLID